jgi:DNA-binding GntR family transcriptional regulator
MDSPPTSALADQAHTYLLNRIESCEYMPGQAISEKSIAEESDFGRTPVREALQRLRRDGLVDVFPRRGMRVAKITEASVREVHRARRLIEPMVLSHFISSYPKRELLSLRSRLQQVGPEDGAAYLDIDVELHTFIVAASGSTTIITVHDGLMRQQFRFATYATLLGVNDPEETRPEHLAIVDAMLSENAERARDALIFHLNHSLASSLRSLDDESD